MSHLDVPCFETVPDWTWTYRSLVGLYSRYSRKSGRINLQILLSFFAFSIATPSLEPSFRPRLSLLTPFLVQKHRLFSSARLILQLLRAILRPTSPSCPTPHAQKGPSRDPKGGVSIPQRHALPPARHAVDNRTAGTPHHRARAYSPPIADSMIYGFRRGPLLRCKYDSKSCLK